MQNEPISHRFNSCGLCTPWPLGPCEDGGGTRLMHLQVKEHGAARNQTTQERRLPTRLRRAQGLAVTQSPDFQPPGPGENKFLFFLAIQIFHTVFKQAQETDATFIYLPRLWSLPSVVLLNLQITPRSHSEGCTERRERFRAGKVLLPGQARRMFAHVENPELLRLQVRSL